MNETKLKLVLDAADEYAEQRARSGCRYYNKSTQAAFDKLKAALAAPPVLDKHPSEVATTDPKKNLGKQIIAMRYDVTHWVIEDMVTQTLVEAAGDKAAGRPKLAAALEKVAERLSQAAQALVPVIEICASHNKHLIVKESK